MMRIGGSLLQEYKLLNLSHSEKDVKQEDVVGNYLEAMTIKRKASFCV
jgi:hypothetical protein